MEAVRKCCRSRPIVGKGLRITAGIVRVCAAVVTIVALLFLGLMVLPRIAGLYPYVILSSSMEPTINAGAVAFVDRKADRAAVGEIIAFFHPEDEEVVVIHRVIGISENGYYTKGDGNEVMDSEELPREKLIGVSRFTVPWLGYVVSEITGISLAWVIALILALNIAAELLRKLTKKKRRKRKR